MKRQPTFDAESLKAIADVLGQTDGGLTNYEIDQLIAQCQIPNISPSLSKRDRLYNALANKLNQTQAAKYVIGFIQKAMKPVRYTGEPDKFEERRSALNAVLSFSGLYLREDGKLTWADKASTLAEAKEREGKLRHELQIRHVHEDVLKFCRAELLQENYFHAVFEATKSIADKIRERTGLQADGAKLVQQAFTLGEDKKPMLAINSLSTESEESEHKGFMNLLIGLFGTFRNTTAHVPKVKWEMNEWDALDILSLTSLVHRKLDKAIRKKQ